MAVGAQESVPLCYFQVFRHHFTTKLLYGDFGRPSEALFCSGRVTQQSLDLGRAEIARIHSDDHVSHLDRRRIIALYALYYGLLLRARSVKGQGNAKLLRRPSNEISDGLLNPGGDDKVFRLVLL